MSVSAETPKFQLTDKTIVHNKIVLRRIRALRDFGNVKIGALGGFVQSEGNLSHQGTAWIADNAKAHSGAMVTDDALLRDNAEIDAFAMVAESAIVENNAYAGDNTIVFGSARLRGRAELVAKASLGGAAIVQGNAVIVGAEVSGKAIISGDTWVSVPIGGETRVGGPHEPKMPHLISEIFGLRTTHDLRYMHMHQIIAENQGELLEDEHQRRLAELHPDHHVFRVKFPAERADEARTALRREGFVLAVRELFRLNSPIETQINPPEPQVKAQAKPARKAKAPVAKVTDAPTAKPPKHAVVVRYPESAPEIAEAIATCIREFSLAATPARRIKAGAHKGLSEVTLTGNAQALAHAAKALKKQEQCEVSVKKPKAAKKSGKTRAK